MKCVLVVGVDNVAGAYLAKTLSNHHQVVGYSGVKAVRIAGCNISDSIPKSPDAINRELAIHAPDLVVLSGAAARSTWSLGIEEPFNAQALDVVAAWSQAVARTNAKLIVISSDAVFHGPWMFHEENCTGVCESREATAIRRMEAQVQQHCPNALIVRTNVFGWSPCPEGGWLEALFDQLAEASPIGAPAANYATPIEASLFAEILVKAWDRGLEGIYHVGSSERVNFAHFAHRLAQEFQLPRPRFHSVWNDELNPGFGQGETSLNSGKIRRAIATPLPMLGECLKRLHEQSEDGWREDRNVGTHDYLTPAA
jgi:dTDP-4-dehydrorhamnose reductase